jgi:hypothetical protein
MSVADPKKTLDPTTFPLSQTIAVGDIISSDCVALPQGRGNFHVLPFGAQAN